MARRYKMLLLWIPTLIVCFIVLWPVWWIVKSSFTSETDLYKVPVQYLPVNLTLNGYRRLFTTVKIAQVLKSTLFVILCTMLTTTLLCALSAYAFARNHSKLMTLSYGYLVFSTMIPMSVTLVPLTVLWRRLGLTDTLPGTVLLYVSTLIPLNTITYAGFVHSIPYSLEESAMLDGANAVQVFLRIVLPLMLPIVATMNIISFIQCINEFFIPLNFTSRNIKMLSTITSSIPIVNDYQLPWDMISAVGVMMVAPSILFVMLFENNIMSGITAGSVKQ